MLLPGVLKKPSFAIAYLSVLAAVLIWSTSFVATKIALVGLPPFTLAAVRLIIATLLLGMGIASAGVFLIMENAAALSGPDRLFGNFLIVCSGLVWAIYNFITRSLAARYPMLTLNFFQSLSATLFLLPFLLLEQGQW